MSTSFPSNSNELTLYNVLQRANLLTYFDAFISQGGDDLNQLCEAGEEEFLEVMALVGMAGKPLHVRRLQKALLEWILHPALFTKPISEKRTMPTSAPSKGSIYAAVQQQQQSHQLSGIQSANGAGVEQSFHFKSAGETRNFQPVRQYTQASLNNPATPNSDEFSDPDGSVASVGASSAKGLGTSSPLPVSVLSEEHLALISAVADDLSQNLPGYAPKPLNMKKPADKELQEIISHLEDNPTRIDLLRKYSAVCGRGADGKRKFDRPNSLYELCLNEAAAQLCRHRPSLLTRREDLLTLATQVVKETGLQFGKESAYSFQPASDLSLSEPRSKIPRTKSPTPIALAASASPNFQPASDLSLSEPRSKIPRTKSPTPTALAASASPKHILSFEEEPESVDQDVPPRKSNFMAQSHANPVAIIKVKLRRKMKLRRQRSKGSSPKAPSLVDEGLRISRQYGLGPEFEEELKAMRSEKLQDADDEDVLQSDWVAMDSETDRLKVPTL